MITRVTLLLMTTEGERMGKGDICENSDQRETAPSPRDQEGFFRNRSNGFGSPRHALSVP